MKKILILLLAVAVLLFVSGCTEEAPPEAPPTPVPTTKAPSPTYLPTTAMPTLETTISVDDNSVFITRDGFRPKDIVIKRGMTVRWYNMDSSEDESLYNPTHRIKIWGVYTGQTISPGQSWSWVFVNNGVFQYQDLVHEDMKGTVTVTWE